MKLTRIHPRRAVVVAVVVGLLVASGGLSLANHEADIVHACIKNGSIELVASEDGCKNRETHVGLATDAALAALEGSNSALSQRVDDLEAFLRRLVGNKAAAIRQSDSVQTHSGEITSYDLSVTFCEEPDPDIEECEAGGNSLTLSVDDITEADRGTLHRFDADNTPRFADIVSLLTNGENNRIAFEEDRNLAGGQGQGGSGSSAPERVYFLRGIDGAQTSSGPEWVDLEGLPISSITVSIDNVLLRYDDEEDETRTFIGYQVFFDLG